MNDQGSILAVDDTSESLALLVNTLTPAGYQVRPADSGELALAAVAADPPDLILLDVRLKGMDGLEVCRQLQADEATRRIPIILISAFAEVKEWVEGLRLGAADYVTKPFQPEELLVRVKTHLAVSRANVSLEQQAGALREAYKQQQREVAQREQVEDKLRQHLDQSERSRRALLSTLEDQKRTEKLLHDSRSASLNMMEDAVAARDEAERAATALRESEKLSRSLIEHLPLRIFLKDRNGVYLRCNPSYANDLGIDPEAIVGKNDFDFYPRDLAEVYRADDRAVMADGVTKDHEEQYLAAGERRWVHTMKLPYRDEQGQITGVLGIFEDITERREAEQQKRSLEAQLRQNQKLESIGTLAGGVAHEINNPINGIMNYAQLVLDKLGKDSPVAEYAGEIIHETERVAGIVRNLLSFARQEKQGHSPARIADIVADTLSLIRSIIRKDQITVEVDVPEDLPKVKCRNQQIQQVIMNLMTNARDALNGRYPAYDEDKTIRVTAREFEKEGRTWIRTTVEDHGAGIAPEILARIFDPFFTSKPRDVGTGLGLSVSHGIVLDHHGELNVESEPGKYTRFHLDLPVDNGWELGGGG